MEWLDLDLPAQAAFRLEQQRRELRACTDPDVLRAVAEGALQLAHQQGNVSRQLLETVARMEAERGQSAVSDRHLQWAQGLLADLPSS